jgi:hypothetical protein
MRYDHVMVVATRAAPGETSLSGESSPLIEFELVLPRLLSAALRAGLQLVSDAATHTALCASEWRPGAAITIVAWPAIAEEMQRRRPSLGVASLASTADARAIVETARSAFAARHYLIAVLHMQDTSIPTRPDSDAAAAPDALVMLTGTIGSVAKNQGWVRCADLASTLLELMGLISDPIDTEPTSANSTAPPAELLQSLRSLGYRI